MINIKTKKGNITMSTTEFARWACLIEAYTFINEKAEEMGINPIDMIKPAAIEQYINDRFHAMLYDIQVEYDLGTF